MAEERYRIKLITDTGLEVYWVKRGAVHTLSRDLAEIWVKNFKPALFRVNRNGEIVPPSEGGEIFAIARVEMVPDTDA